MKKMKLSVSAAIAVLSILTASCTTLVLEENTPSDITEINSKVKLRLSQNTSTKSSISPDDNMIGSICMMAYRLEDGMLADTQTAKSTDEIELELTAGVYNIYVTANMDSFVPPLKEEDMNDASYTVQSLSQFGSVIPMCWKGRTEIRGGSNTIVYANLARLVSKVGLKVDMGVLKGLKIKSAKVCQGAGKIRPFMDGGSRIISSEEAIDGDYATDDDIRTLMTGDPIFFYITENCQGKLLPDNQDPWGKVPDSIGEVSELCTYVEMVGIWDDGADYEGSVTYRFYLGEDASTNFDIRRNSIHNLTLYLEEDNFDRISWKIDASKMEAVDWNVYTNVQNNFHEICNYYVTENIRVEFTLDEQAQKYWNKRDYAFTLAAVDYEGNDVIRFNEIKNLGRGKFQASGTCIRPGEFDLLMVNTRNSAIECYMISGTVKVPVIIAGNEGLYADKVVEGFNQNPKLNINGNSCEICLYLTDEAGYNLNQGHFWGCDFDVCDWHCEILNNINGDDLTDKVIIETITGDSCSDGYAVCYLLRIENDGDDDDWNRTLTETLGNESLDFSFTEKTSGAIGEHDLALTYEKLDITFKPVPEQNKSVLGTEFMYVVDNPSNLPVKIRGLKMNSLHRIPSVSTFRHILCDPIPDLDASFPVLIDRMPYTICSLDSNASKSVVIDGKRCFAADDYGFDQSDVPNQRSMFHTFELGYLYSENTWFPKITGKVDLYDTKENSSLYGKDGYGNCGIIIHTDNGESLELIDSNNGSLTDFREYGSVIEKDFIDKFHNMIEVQLGINENNEITVTSSRNCRLNISVDGRLRGHIRCVSIKDPLSKVWGHYFTHVQYFSHSKTLDTGPEPSTIDGGVLKEAFDAMRREEYYSILDIDDIDEFRHDPGTKTGTIREYLKPEYLYMAFDVTSADGAPVSVSFSGTASYNHTISSPVTWSTGLFSSVTMVPSTYSGFDGKLEEYDCPPGETFAAELVTLEPHVYFSNTQGLYCR